MYIGPEVVPATRRPAGSRAALPTIAAICCGLCLIFLFAGTIVVALIPIYLPHKDVQVDESSLRTQEFTLIAEVEENPSIIGRRKREPGDLSPITPSVFAEAGRAKVAQVLFNALRGINSVKNVVCNSASLVYDASSRKKRLSIVKRQGSKKKIFLVAKCYLEFKSFCLHSCQRRVIPSCRNSILGLTDDFVVLTDVLVILSNGQLVTQDRIEWIRIRYLSLILLAGEGGGNLGQEPPTELSTEGTTTVATTPNPMG